MKKMYFYFIIVLTIGVHLSHADKASDLQAYPSNQYLVGLSEGDGTIKSLRQQAEAELSQKLFDKVSHIINENEGEWLAYNRVREHYGIVIQSSVQAKLKGIREHYPPTAPNTYVIVYIKRDELKQLYSDKAANLRQEINDVLRKAQTIEAAGDLADAAQVYFSTYRLYEALKEAELIQLGAEYKPAPDAFAKLADTAAGIAKSNLLMSHGEVAQKVAKIAPETIIDIKDVAIATAYQFRQQNSELGTRVNAEELTFASFNVVSPSSKLFLQALTDELKWYRTPPMRGFQPIHVENDVEEEENEDVSQEGTLQFFGAYWEDGDKITLRSILRDTSNGEFAASALVQFHESQRRDKQIALKPDNLEQFEQDWNLFNPSEEVSIEEIPQVEETQQIKESLVSPKVFASKGLKVEIATDRGTGHLVYTEGETMTVFAQTNQETYIRLIYILADGKRTLLLKNHHIPAENANQSMEIGKFVCTPPFGAEQLHVYAKREPFPDFKPSETYEEDGYIYLITTRGFQPIKAKPEETSHISITTVPK